MRKTWVEVRGDAWYTFCQILGGAGLEALFEEDIQTGDMRVLYPDQEVVMCAELANLCYPHEER